ncbi:MAG: carboxypeptidase-like regulatory domain-containing protein [Candidatus Dojkabacteria bacterium]|nr:MAG: carboxypeptidase-like regulatory domain-containing protein [Candidatus Dojkabacteria bacterium]
MAKLFPLLAISGFIVLSTFFLYHLSLSLTERNFFTQGEVLGLGTQKSPILQSLRSLDPTSELFRTRLAADDSYYTLTKNENDMDVDMTAGVDNIALIGGEDIYVLSRYEANGSYDWSLAFSDAGSDRRIRDMEIASDGAIVLVGDFSTTFDFDPTAGTDSIAPISLRDAFFTKINSDGTYAWTKSIGSSNPSLSVESENIAVDSTGGIYISGMLGGTVDFDPGPGVADKDGPGNYLLKLDLAGDFEWVRVIEMAIDSIAVNNATGAVYVDGSFWGTDIEFNDSGVGSDTHTATGVNVDDVLVQYRTNGDYGWSRVIESDGGLSNSAYEFVNVSPFNDQVYWGNFLSDSSIDADGTVGVDTINKVNTDPADSDFVLIRYEDNGDYVGGRTITGDQYSIDIADMVFGPTGEIYIAGSIYPYDTSPIDLDYTEGVFMYTPASDWGGGYIMKMEEDTDFVWIYPTYDPTENYGTYLYNINRTSAGLLMVSGVYGGLIDMNPSQHTVTNLPFIDGGDYGGFIAFYTDGFMTYIANLDPSLRVVDQGTSFDAEIASEIFMSGTRTVRLREDSTNLLLADAFTQMNEIRDWATVQGETDLALEKTYVGSLQGNDGVSGNIDIYVPIDDLNDNSVVVCPLAVSIVEVATNCPSAIILAENAPSVSKVNIASQDYWKVTGLTNGGVISHTVVITPTPSSSPTVSPSPTVTPTSTPTSTPTPTPTATETPTPTITPTLTITPTNTLAITPSPTQSFTSGDTNVSCPTITTFSANKTVITPGTAVSFAWSVSNTDHVDIIPYINNAPFSGNRIETISLDQQITLVATKGDCVREKTITIMTQPVAPETITSGLVLGFAAVEIATVAVSSVVAPVVSSSHNMFSFGFAMIDRLRRRYPWGVVYDSKTKKPLGRAIIRATNTQTKQVITSVTDALGVFRIFLKQGTYTISVTKTDYEFPSKLITTTEDKGYMNVYHGEEFTVHTDGELVMKSFPMDPAGETKVSSLLNLWISISPYLEYLNSFVLFVGIGLSLYTVVVNPTLSNFLLIAFYLGLAITKLLLLQVPTAGTVKDSQGNPVRGMEIGLFDGEFKNLVATTFTDDKGQFSFYAKNDDYTIKVLDSKYEMVTENIMEGIRIPKEGGNNGGRVIMTDLKVRQKAS